MERKYRHRNKIEWLADPRHLYRLSAKRKRIVNLRSSLLIYKNEETIIGDDVTKNLLTKQTLFLQKLL